MIIFPAIDIKDGKVVRLLQGRFDLVTEYSSDPSAMARHWVERGAQWLHVIDLDGAQFGEMKNFDTICQLAQTVNVPIQVGGGIRDEKIIEKLLEAGIQRVILGTKVIEDQKFLKRLLTKWKDRIAVSLDCSQGKVAKRGWTDVTELEVKKFARELQELGLGCLIYTDISRDGMLLGPNFTELTSLLETTDLPVIASGGVSNLDDVKKLNALESKGLVGIITGKAIYEGTLDLESAIKLCSQNA